MMQENNMLKRIFLLFLINIFVLTINACNKSDEEYINKKEGISYYQKGEYEKAIPLLEEEAKSGNAAASYYLGLMQQQGKGMEKDWGKSCRSFLKATEAGYRDAYLMTGACYFMGKGFPHDFRQAFEWTKKAADESDETRMSEGDRHMMALLLGHLYASGKGTLQDLLEAARWYRKAAEMGDATSQGILAFYYYSGKGVVTDKEKAKYWAEKAVSQGISLGEVILGMLEQYRDKPDMKKAIEWYERAANKKDRAAYYQLAIIYEEGLSVEKDINKARYYYHLAAASGNDDIIRKQMDFEVRHFMEKAKNKKDEK